ncbi:MAG: hypothetical protein FJW92_04945 [Actinobacteria bacterium]|nr:hypothetical protein [Actinomycetota bacterium]
MNLQDLITEVAAAGHGATALLVHRRTETPQAPHPDTTGPAAEALERFGARVAVAWNDDDRVFAAAAAAAHRAEAFAACRWMAEALAAT